MTVSILSAISANMGTITAGSITGGTITGGTIRTAASGARVEISGSDNRINIYNSTPTNIGWFGGTGNGNFININQPDTNEDFPPVYITSAQDSNVMNLFNTNSGINNRPAFRFESNNANSEVMFVKQTGAYNSLVIEGNSSSGFGSLFVAQLGTSVIIGTNVSGCFLTKGGTWTDASSRKIKENFEAVTVLNKLKNLDIKKYNYISEQRRNKKQLREYFIDSKKKQKYSQTDKGRKGGYADKGYLKIKLNKKELDDVALKVLKELPKEQSRLVQKHISPMAEDFKKMFDVGDGMGLAPKDIAGVALQAIKELATEVEQLKIKIGI